MTKAQYEQFENYQFLTDQEKDYEKECNVKNKYGVTYKPEFDEKTIVKY